MAALLVRHTTAHLDCHRLACITCVLHIMSISATLQLPRVPFDAIALTSALSTMLSGPRPLM